MESRIYPRLSVLDLVPVTDGQSSRDAIESSLHLAMVADQRGYERYWFGEHHNSPSAASTAPEVLIAAAAVRTPRIRVGSGGVLLPLHPTGLVAETFALLSALTPGRIDLGLGRATTPDPPLTELLAPGADSGEERFTADVTAVINVVAPLASAADPAAAGVESRSAPPLDQIPPPDIWLLGASEVTAGIAARMGLPYVYANHISTRALANAVRIYRGQYRPSRRFPEPRLMLTVAVATGRTRELAEERALPQRRMNARLRARLPLQSLETIEIAQANPWTGLAATSLAKTGANWIIGTPDDAREQLAGLAESWAVDEIMIWPVSGMYEHEPTNLAVGRRETLEDLAG